MNISYPVCGTTEEWWNPDSGAGVGGHVSLWKWRHRLMEVGCANNYSFGSADGTALNWMPRYEEDWKIRDSSCDPRYQSGEITGVLWIVSPLHLMTRIYLSIFLWLASKWKKCVMEARIQACNAYAAARYTDRLTWGITLYSPPLKKWQER